MRQLTSKQKKVLDAWIENHKVKSEIFSLIHGNPPFLVNGNPCWGLDIDSLDMETWGTLKDINDTEILYQNVDRYLIDKSLEIIHK